MTNNAGDTMDKRNKDLKNAFNQLTGDSLDGLNDFINIQTMACTLFHHEAKRLSNQLGKEHPQVKQLEENTKNSLNLIRGLNVERETANIRSPDVPEEGALVHGRLTDKASRGIPGLSVCGEDENGKYLRLFGRTETNASGYYAVQVEKDVLKKLQKTAVYLAVGIGLGRVIHREEKPLALKPDSRLTINIVLDREILWPTEKPTRPSGKTHVKKAEEDGEIDLKEESRIDISELRGIGSKTSDKLRKAGIKDIATFVEKDDAELQAIMGNINVVKIRKDNADLLRKVKGD